MPQVPRKYPPLEPSHIKDANGLKFTPGYPLCQGCENLTVASGWECFFKKDTEECEYPDDMFKRLITKSEKS